MQIKICGIRFADEAEELKNLIYVDYFGIVFANGSEYRVSVATGRVLSDIFHKAGKKVVGIFADQSLEEVKSTAKSCQLDVIQFDGRETPDFCRKMDGIVWKSFFADEELSDIAYYIQYIENPVFVCRKNEDCEIIQKYNGVFTVSGEINIDNLDIMCKLKPKIISIGKSFETKGRKDKAKIIQAIQVIRDLTVKEAI